ncbi:MAG: radical SAM protein [Nitrospirae bacterium]|nr:radical SAM protein [Nitrospirota bacterium]
MGKIRTFTDLGFNILRAKVIKKRQPVFLSLFITNKCNLRCKYCFVIDDTVPKDILNAEYSKKEVFEIVDEFYEMGTRMIFMLGGEPLVHKDIREIVNYIVNKGIYLHLITNGTLLEKKLDDIRNAHVVCVSLDGVGDKNDDLRGQGVFNRVVGGIKAAVNAGIPCRIHAVLTRKNLKDIRSLAGLARDLKISLTISPPNFLGETNLPFLRITREEYKEFWKEYLDMYKAGLPIANSPEAIVKCLEWPTDYHRYIKVGERFDNYKPIFCLNGYTYAALGAEGTMYNCINRGCLNGPNIKEIGIKKAWDILLDWRKDCVSCASINCIETAMMLNFHLATLFRGYKFHSGF